MVMTKEDLKEHADNLRETLHRKASELWDCPSLERQKVLLRQTDALQARITDLDRQISDSE